MKTPLHKLRQSLLLLGVLLTLQYKAQTVLLQETFEGSFPPAGWTLNTPGATFADGWTQGPSSPLLSSICVPQGSKAMCSQWASFYPNNTWAFTPGQSLTAGTTYQISFKQCVQSPSNNKTESLKITVGSMATEAAQTTLLLDLPTLTNSSPLSRGASFTPTVSGIYYFAFNCYSAQNQRYLSIDSVNVYTNAAPASFPAPYCANQFPQGVEPITLLSIAGIYNASSPALSSAAHENFTALTGSVQTNTTYSIAVKGNTNGNYNCMVSAFIDWNQNNSLTDAGEEYQLGFIANSTGVDAVVLTSNIAVPANATLGNTRLRIIKKQVLAAAPCNTLGLGQAEDYTLFVSGVTGIDVQTQNNIPAYITTANGTLQMTSIIYPSTMSQAVTWSIRPGTGAASISNAGLVTAQQSGSVWAKAVSVADASMKDSLQITITNQPVAVSSIDVQTQNNVPASIVTDNGTLQLLSTILPANASQAVNWSIASTTGSASINGAGLVTAINNGKIWARAISVADASKKDSIEITISNQLTVGINEVDFSASLNCYPNPVRESLVLHSTQAHPALRLELIDLTGRVLQAQTLGANALQQPFLLDFSKLETGIYFIRLNGASVRMTRKILKSE